MTIIVSELDARFRQNNQSSTFTCYVNHDCQNFLKWDDTLPDLPHRINLDTIIMHTLIGLLTVFNVVACSCIVIKSSISLRKVYVNEAQMRSNLINTQMTVCDHAVCGYAQGMACQEQSGLSNLNCLAIDQSLRDLTVPLPEAQPRDIMGRRASV